MIFQTQYTHKSQAPEKNSGKRLIEKAGYVSAQQRITNLMLAGKRLAESRDQQYDFTGKIDEDFTDPTRNRGLDMGEAFQIKLSVEERQKRKEAILKASQTAPEAPQGVKKGVNDIDIV